MSNKNTKPQRKESMSIRIEPQLRYLIDIASRVQRRSLTNYVEWVLEESLKNVKIGRLSLSHLALQLWDVNESERLIKLACVAPELLTYDEQLIFKVLIDKELDFLDAKEIKVIFLNNSYQVYLFGGNGKMYPLRIHHFNTSKINRYWEKILLVSQGDCEARQFILDNEKEKQEE